MAKTKQNVKKWPLTRRKWVWIISGVITSIIVVLIIHTIFSAYFSLDKTEDIVVKKVDLIKSSPEPENASEDDVNTAIAAGKEIENRITDMKKEKEHFIPLVGIVIAIIAAIVPAVTYKKKRAISMFFLFFITIPAICSAGISAGKTYYFDGSTFDKIHDIYYESSPLLLDFEDRKKLIAQEKEKISKNDAISESPQTEPEPKLPESPQPYKIDLNDPFFTDFFKNSPNDAHFLAQCFDPSYIPYSKIQEEIPDGYSSKINFALEDEDTFNDFLARDKYEEKWQKDRFIYIERSIDARVQGDALYATKDDDLYEWYALSGNRREISNDYDVLGLEYYRIEDWTKALESWENSVCWQSRTLRSIITEKKEDTDKITKACNTIIHIYQKQISTLKNKPDIDNEKIIKIETIVEAYEIFKDDLIKIYG